MTAITNQSINKLKAEILYLKETSSINDILCCTWLDGLSVKSKSTFDFIKNLASADYSSVSLAIDLLNDKIKFDF